MQAPEVQAQRQGVLLQEPVALMLGRVSSSEAAVFAVGLFLPLHTVLQRQQRALISALQLLKLSWAWMASSAHRWSCECQ